MTDESVSASTRSAIELRDLKVHFPVGASRLFSGRSPMVVKAVDGLSLKIEPDEIFGLAGESGCGKSTVARVLAGLVKPTSGDVLVGDRRLGDIRRLDLPTKIQMVFQDPYGSLNPRRIIGDIIGDPLAIHTRLARQERQSKVEQILESVGLLAHHFHRFPHEFSGGQRQRIAIARALILDPSFLVLDEPTSALDVSVQAVILNLIRTLKQERELGCLFITHDLNLMRFMTTRLAVMYLGRIVEMGNVEDIFSAPLHPYTKALVDSTPQAAAGRRRVKPGLEGELPSPVNPPSGCPFHTRCPAKIGTVCETHVPKLTTGNGRLVACHLHNSASVLAQ